MEKEMGRRIKAYTEAAGMSQSDLAAAVGVGTTSVSNWVNGTKVPRMDKVDAMCRIFGCRRSDLLDVPAGATYYFDDRTAELAQELMENKDLRILMDASRDLTPENVAALAALAKQLKGTNPNG